ncbi:hypothetical protein, partial [Paenibacillus xylanexedens]|uniref:hypothetical protein n=1 Tax=Paenibacillus xylanexedens TaxID=528191 RepID=UPI001C92C8DF
MGGCSARDFGEGRIELWRGACVVRDDGWKDMEWGEGIVWGFVNVMVVELGVVEEVDGFGSEGVEEESEKRVRMGLLME